MTDSTAKISAINAGTADPYDLGLLRDEAKRIKASLLKEYGPKIEEMLNEERKLQNGGVSVPLSQADIWQKEIDELLKYQVPLRDQIKRSQHEAIQKLVEGAKESHARGIDVQERMNLLLSMQQK